MSSSSAAISARLRALGQAQSRGMRFGAAFSVVAELLWLAQAWFIAGSIAGMAQGHGEGLVTDCLAILGTGMMRVALGWMASRQCELAADRSIAEIRSHLLGIADRRAPDALAAPSGEVAALLTDKMALLRVYLSRWPVARSRVMVLPLAILAVSLPLSWAVALVLAISGPLIPVFMALIGLAARDASARQMDEISNLNALLVDRLGALVDIRLLGARSRMASDFSTRADNLRQRTMEVLRIAFLSSAVLELFSALGVAMTAVYVGFTLLGEIGFGTWGQGLGIDEGIWLLLLAPAFFQPLRDLASVWHDRIAAQSIAEELIAFENARSPEILGQGVSATCLQGAIRTRQMVLRGRSFPDLEIMPGEAIALTGPTGSGKTTLLFALAGLLPNGGALHVADEVIDQHHADQWRAGLALIPQHVHFMDASLRWNLTLGTNFSEDQLAQALELAQARQVVVRLPQGLETVLGENGGGVSGGEARRLTIARAALLRRDWILADEPTADLDDLAAQAVIEGLLALNSAGAGLIVASHDPRLIARMQRQVRLG